MEVPGGQQNKGLVLLYEFLGTFCFLTIINFSGTGWIIGLGLFICALSFGSVSGGHFNPAVTLAVYIKEASLGHNVAGNFVYAILIMVAQVAGSLASCYVCRMAMVDIGGGKKFPEIGNLCPAFIGKMKAADPKWGPDLCDAKGFYGQVIMTETLATFLFIFYILCIKYHNGAQDGILTCLGVGVCLAGLATAASGISGGCLNPAVAIGKTLTQATGKTVTTKSLIPYLAGTFGGGFLAGIVSIGRAADTKRMKED